MRVEDFEGQDNSGSNFCRWLYTHLFRCLIVTGCRSFKALESAASPNCQCDTGGRDQAAEQL